MTQAFVDAAERLRCIVIDRDRDGVARTFAEVRAFFEPFTDEAMEQSSFLIDRLVERT